MQSDAHQFHNNRIVSQWVNFRTSEMWNRNELISKISVRLELPISEAHLGGGGDQ
jgi:hypothetical protein